jgi:hypothetical protein
MRPSSGERGLNDINGIFAVSDSQVGKSKERIRHLIVDAKERFGRNLVGIHSR